MKLITGGIKDYYDHVAMKYGGGDPRVIYHRKRIGEVEDQKYGSTLFTKDKLVTMKEWARLRSGMEQKASFGGYYPLDNWLIVAGKGYPLVQTGRYPDRFEIFDHKKHDKIVRQTKSLFNPKPSTMIGVELPHLVDLSKAVGHPVFIMKDVGYNFKAGLYEFRIDGDCPKLAQLGLPSIYPADQLYQDLAYFIGNTMKDSPDLAPQTKMSDAQKVDAHGFDKKISFRHRK